MTRQLTTVLVDGHGRGFSSMVAASPVAGIADFSKFISSGRFKTSAEIQAVDALLGPGAVAAAGAGAAGARAGDAFMAARCGVCVDWGAGLRVGVCASF